MSYLILNNKKSTDIGGLIIQTLPPIIKPKIRSTVEEIDGRDGDIVTELGYSAYDKEVTIGLSFNYNIDEIIEYFNSEGQVVFSNEPDKVYNYKIYQQIDFNALLRFKTAVIIFHVQPFKHLLDEEQIKLENLSIDEISINNQGNYFAKPVITIYGQNTVKVMLNSIQIFTIELGNEEYITIDTENMEAYKDTLNTLKNRLVTGNYDNFILKKGINTLSFEGTVTKIEISNYSRWI